MLKQADDNFGVQYLRSYFVTGDEGKQQFPQALRLLLSAISRNVNSHHALNFLWVQIHLHKNILKYFLLHLISWQGGSPRTDRKIQSHSPYASSLTSQVFYIHPWPWLWWSQVNPKRRSFQIFANLPLSTCLDMKWPSPASEHRLVPAQPVTTAPISRYHILTAVKYWVQPSGAGQREGSYLQG